MSKILVLIDYYLPGHKFGGPIRTISNLVRRLSPHFKFFIFTFDRDEGDEVPYPNLESDRWIGSDHAQVFYTQDRTLRNILRRTREVSPDLIYLNSFFSRATIRVLIARKLKILSDIPILLAPRGEFAEGALAIKPWRKSLYVALVNATRLLKDVTTQASSEHEKKDMERHLTWARSHPPRVVPNLSDPDKLAVRPIQKQPGFLKIVFLSRISRNKNLDGAIRMLHGLRGKVEFSICGPIGDPEYWKECQDLIQCVPDNVSVRQLGDVDHQRVAEVLAQHHLMFLPSHGENFGHAIAEALAAGRPVLISDRTPWTELESRRLGADIPLDRPDLFLGSLQTFVDMGDEEYSRWSYCAREYAVQKASDPVLLEQNLQLIQSLIRGCQ